MSRPALLRATIAASVAVALAGPAFAQTPASPVQPQPGAPNMPAPRTTVPEKVESTGSTGTLSDKLERSDGVIRPPSNVDSNMTVKPAPDVGTMPVIPPPGSPGGNPRLDPK